MYMKKHTTIRRLFTLALVLVMVLAMAPALAVPTIAANGNVPPFQITINTNDNISDPDDVDDDDPEKTKLETRFWAYQIFIGEIKKGADGVGGYNPGTDEGTEDRIGDPKANQLANVKWGVSVNDKEGLVAALKGDSTLAKDVGIDYEKMVAGGDTYFKATDAYDDPNNWEDEKIGGKLTTEGRRALEEALQTAADSLTLGDLFTAALGSTSPTSDTAAALVAKVLSDFTPASGNTLLAQAFVAIVTEKNGSNYKYLTTTGNAKYVPNGKTASEYPGAYAVSGWDGEHSQWTIGTKDGNEGNLSAGYYLIRDAYEETAGNKVNSDYIVAVFGDSTINPKPEHPVADKTIVGAPDPGKGDSSEIGKEITFQVKGTLPENYDTAYEHYFYKFTDTMSAGLTYLGGGTPGTPNDVLRVYVKVYNSVDGKFGPNEYDYYLVDLDTTEYTDGSEYKYKDYGGKGYVLDVSGTAGAKIELTIPDLKKLKGKKVIPTEADPWNTGESEAAIIPATNSSEIHIEYTAALNENAVVKETGNTNSVGLEYSSDPKWDGEGEPDTDTTETENKTYVYSFGVAIYKYDGSEGDTYDHDNQTNALKDVGFALTKSGKWYPYFSTNNATTADGWVSEEDVLAYLSHFGIDAADAGDYLEGNKKLPGDDSIDPIPAADMYLASNSERAPEVINSMTAYALLRGLIGTPTPDHYAIAGWLPEVELEDVLDGILGDDKDNTITDAEWEASIAGTKVSNYLGAGFEATGKTYNLVVKTDGNGYLRIEGMGVGNDITYNLVEIVTPDGFDTIDPISMKFTAEYNKDGTLKKASKSVNGEEAEDIYNTNPETGTGDWVGDYDELAIENDVPNYPAGFLPGTGGMGTTLFYIAGIALLVGAVLFLIFSNVKKKPEQRVR